MKSYESYETSVEQLKLVPNTYLMSEIIVTKCFTTSERKKPNNMWLIKPRTGSGGCGLK